MTPLSPQDRNKAIVLIAAVVLVFGFLFWRILGAGGGGGSPAPAATTVDTSPKVATNAATPAGMVDVVLPMSAGSVDPFRKVISAETGSGPTNAGTTPPRPPSGFGEGILPPVKPTNVPPEMSVQPKLIGVVTGGDPVAVFSVAGHEVVLRIGEKLDTGEVLEAVRGETAVLRKNGKRTLLSVTSARQN